MDKRVHVFVRKHTVGVAVQAITQPHLCAFAGDLATARADLAVVLGKLLARGELDEPMYFEDARLKKVDLVVRALARGRLLAMPMRFSVLTYGGGPGRKKVKSGPLQVLVPRLGIGGFLQDAADLPAYVEEVVRHHLYLAPLERLLEVAYVGEESLDHLVVSARPRDVIEPRRVAQPAVTVAKPLPPGLAEACRRLDDEAARGSSTARSSGSSRSRGSPRSSARGRGRARCSSGSRRWARRRWCTSWRRARRRRRAAAGSRCTRRARGGSSPGCATSASGRRASSG